MAPAAAVLAGAASGGGLAATSGGAGFGLDVVRQLASVADVNRLLHEASARERAIDAELEQLLSKRGELENCLMELQASTDEVRGCSWMLSSLHFNFLQMLELPSCACTSIMCAACPALPFLLQMLQVMKAEAEALAASTGDTAALAEKVSRKVRSAVSLIL